MCLVFRIALLSLNWWVISVVAQEVPDVASLDDLTRLSEMDPAAQAQPPQDDKKVREEPVQKEDEKKAEEIKTETQKAEDLKKAEEAKKNVTPPVQEVKKEDDKKLEEVKKDETSPAEAAKQEEPKADDVKKLEETKKESVPLSEDLKKAEEAKKLAEAKTEKQKPKKEAKPKDLDSEDMEIKGIDTVDLDEPRGNWLFKKIWWGRAENKYEKIRAAFESVLESRIIFFTKRSAADKDLFAPFYFEIGMSNGELQETVSQLINHIEKERRQEGELSTAGRETLKLLMSEKKSLESINAAVLAVNKLDLDIDETLRKLMEQVDRARKYELEAWKNFKDIGRVLNDKKARELFYQMDTAYNNIKDIQEYITQALAVHLDRVVGSAKNQTERIKSTIDILKKKGHDLKTLTDKVSGAMQAKSTPVEQEDEGQDEEPEEELGFFANIFSSIKSGFVTAWDSITYVFTLPFSWFSSAEPTEEESVDEESISESEEEERS